MVIGAGLDGRRVNYNWQQADILSAGLLEFRLYSRSGRKHSHLPAMAFALQTIVTRGIVLDCRCAARLGALLAATCLSLAAGAMALACSIVRRNFAAAHALGTPAIQSNLPRRAHTARQ
jgi:hypothetical protein